MNRKLIILIGIVVLLIGTHVPADAALDLHAYPIVPALRGYVASRVQFLVRRGKRLGNRTDVFSKIGDSITNWPFFLTPIGSGSLDLGGYSDLQNVVAVYSQEGTRVGNSFSNVSLGAGNSWTSDDLLDPGKADPGTCASGETPVACELRVTKPSVALVMIGTNDLVSGDVNHFSKNLNRILTIIENHYVVPVVSTIPYRRDDLVLQDRVYTYNVAIVRTASSHGAPLWNYWLAMESLPSNGVSIDGIHPSLPPDNRTTIFDNTHLQFGFTMRNLTALQVLQRLMTYVK
jgi:hypothetical protein